MAGAWIYWYNTERPHFGNKMNGKTPYEKLLECGHTVPIEFCAFPPIILDKVSTELVINFYKRYKQGGNDVCDYDICSFRLGRCLREDEEQAYDT